MFKVGDKVICIDPHNALKLNEIYIIKKLTKYPCSLVMVEGIEEDFYPYRFQLAYKKEFEEKLLKCLD